MKLILLRDKKGRPRVLCFNPDENWTWPSTEPIIQHLRDQYAQLDVAEHGKNYVFGGEIWVVLIDGLSVVVDQDDYGDIRIYAKEREGDRLIEQIATSLGSEFEQK